MTVGKMIELLGSKVGASCGRFHYGSVFGEPSGHANTVDAISETLVKSGFNYNGKDFLYSGCYERTRVTPDFDQNRTLFTESGAGKGRTCICKPFTIINDNDNERKSESF